MPTNIKTRENSLSQRTNDNTIQISCDGQPECAKSSKLNQSFIIKDETMRR